MASTTAICNSYRVELLQGLHDFTVTTGDAFKMALFTSTATNGAATTAYAVTNEVSGTGYTAGGVALTNTTPLNTGAVAFTTFNGNAVWSSASFTAASCLIYNSTNGNRAVQVHDFGGDQTVTSGTFTVQMPTNDSTNALIRIA